MPGQALVPRSSARDGGDVGVLTGLLVRMPATPHPLGPALALASWVLAPKTNSGGWLAGLAGVAGHVSHEAADEFFRESEEAGVRRRALVGEVWGPWIDLDKPGVLLFADGQATELTGNSPAERRS